MSLPDNTKSYQTKMAGKWWIQVLKLLLLIGGIEKNPGPRKKRQSLTNKKEKNKRHVRYNFQLQSKENITPKEEEQQDESLLVNTEGTTTNKRKCPFA